MGAAGGFQSLKKLHFLRIFILFKAEISVKNFDDFDIESVVYVFALCARRQTNSRETSIDTTNAQTGRSGRLANPLVLKTDGIFLCCIGSQCSGNRCTYITSNLTFKCYLSILSLVFPGHHLANFVVIHLCCVREHLKAQNR